MTSLCSCFVPLEFKTTLQCCASARRHSRCCPQQLSTDVLGGASRMRGNRCCALKRHRHLRCRCRSIASLDSDSGPDCGSYLQLQQHRTSYHLLAAERALHTDDGRPSYSISRPELPHFLESLGYSVLRSCMTLASRPSQAIENRARRRARARAITRGDRTDLVRRSRSDGWLVWKAPCCQWTWQGARCWRARARSLRCCTPGTGRPVRCRRAGWPKAWPQVWRELPRPPTEMVAQKQDRWRGMSLQDWRSHVPRVWIL